MTWQATAFIDPTAPDPDQPGANVSVADMKRWMLQTESVQEVIKRIENEEHIYAAIDAAVALAVALGRRTIVTLTGHSNPSGKPAPGMSPDFIRIEATPAHDR